MKSKKKENPAPNRFTRGARVGTKSGHARRGAAGRRAERAANEGDAAAHVPDEHVPPA